MSKKEIIVTALGVALGCTAGFAYYYYIGCASGSCAITSHPVNSTLYGGLMGGLLFSSFKTEKSEKKEDS